MNLQELYTLGLRKFFLVGIGQLGCIPNQLATGVAPPKKCVSVVNDMVQLFNIRLRSLVDQLKKTYHDATFVYGNTYGAFADILMNATVYGKIIIYQVLHMLHQIKYYYSAYSSI